ncbi:hypothetical protein [Actinophytocola xanthii]|uniref:hypothetical protein n=1 Tax=Actinophytocola xanthii TaxID=1912961 RepID=UPI001177BDF2|nr:hypothetical protein [Actinophytocola xanthii]
MKNLGITCTAGYLMPWGTPVSVGGDAHRVNQAKRQRYTAAARPVRVPALIVDFPYPLSALTCELRT